MISYFINVRLGNFFKRSGTRFRVFSGVLPFNFSVDYKRLSNDTRHTMWHVCNKLEVLYGYSNYNKGEVSLPLTQYLFNHWTGLRPSVFNHWIGFRVHNQTRVSTGELVVETTNRLRDISLVHSSPNFEPCVHFLFGSRPTFVSLRLRSFTHFNITLNGSSLIRTLITYHLLYRIPLK